MNDRPPRLILGDCLVEMAGIDDASVDLILADLPYGVNGCRWDEVIPFGPLWSHYRRLLRPKGAVILTATQPFTSALIMSYREWFRYCLVWDKVVGTNFQHANHQPLKSHEDIVVFSPAPAIMTRDDRSMTYNPQRWPRDPEKLRPDHKGIGGPLMRMRNGLRKGRNYDERSCFPRSILTFHGGAGDCNSSKRVHSSQKPVPLMEYLVRTYSNPGEVVLDNCFGSCTTGVACLNTDREFIGIEKDPEIFAIASRRLAEVAASTPLFSGEILTTP